MRKFNCFIFDFDGTIAHSDPAYRKAFHHSILLHTGLEVAEDELRWSGSTTPEEFLGRYRREMLDDMMVSFEEHYYANHHHYLTAYDGIAELLEGLRDAGAHCAVVSLKPRRAGELELDIIKLRQFIKVAVWGDDIERPKPEPDGVLRAMSEIGADPFQTLVIGDSPADIMMGRAARACTAAALWSGFGKERLIAEAPDFEFHSPADLFELI